MRGTIAALAALLVSASVAHAQTTATPQPGASGGPIVVERIYSRFVVGPDYKVTSIDGDTGQLAGISAGWLREELFYVGGAFYRLLSGPSDWDLYYGGLVIGLQMPPGERVAFGVKGLLGIGEAQNRFAVTEFLPLGNLRFGTRHLPAVRFPFVPGDTRIEVSDTFAVFEPEASVSVKVTNRIRFGVSAGYRFAGTDDNYLFEDRLNGATGTITVQVGVGGR